MDFTFETEITETPGAVNTAAKITALLAASKVEFSQTQRGYPAIFAKFPGKKEQSWVATLKDVGNRDNAEISKDGGNWWRAYATAGNGYKGDGKSWHGHESILFPHLTAAAKELVDEWVAALCAEYETRIKVDSAVEANTLQPA